MYRGIVEDNARAIALMQARLNEKDGEIERLKADVILIRGNAEHERLYAESNAARAQLAESQFQLERAKQEIERLKIGKAMWEQECSHVEARLRRELQPAMEAKLEELAAALSRMQTENVAMAAECIGQGELIQKLRRKLVKGEVEAAIAESWVGSPDSPPSIGDWSASEGSAFAKINEGLDELEAMSPLPVQVKPFDIAEHEAALQRAGGEGKLPPQ